MDSLPLEIYQHILGYVIEAEPIAHVVNTRLVNYRWQHSITSLLIRSTRLETELGINSPETRDVRNDRWQPFPLRLKMLFMWNKVNRHSRTPTTFSVWVENMLESRGIDYSDPYFREDVIQQLIGGAAVGNLIPVEVFRAAQSLSADEGTRVPDLLMYSWEPLEETYWILVAANAMSMGDAEALDYFLTHGYDMTALSMRFRVWIMKGNGSVVNEEVVRVLEKHSAPFIFEGTSFRIDRQYLYRAIELGQPGPLNELLDHLKKRFRRAMGLLVNAGILYARAIGKNDLATALEIRQINDALDEFPYLSSLEWMDARTKCISLDSLFET